MAAIRKQALLRRMVFEENLRTHPSAEWSLNTGSALNDALEIAQFRSRMKSRTTDGVAETVTILPPISSQNKPMNYIANNRHTQTTGKTILAPNLFDRFSPVSDQIAMIMRDENIGRLPSSLALVGHVKIVDLSNNHLRHVSDGIGELTSLRELNLSSNYLQSLPEAILSCRRLESLNLRHNDIARMPALDNLSRLTALDLSNNPSMEDLDPSLATLRSLSELDVRYCALRLLPDALCSLRSSLTALRASHNTLVELPARFGRLASLRTLDLANNLLADLPACSLERLAALRSLDLSNNRLAVLPRALGLLAALEALLVTANRLRALPTSCAHLTALTELDVARNRLRGLPDTSRMLRLRALRVNSNRLRALPRGLHRLTALVELEAGGNRRLRAPPPCVLLQGTRSALDFLLHHEAAAARADPAEDADRASSDSDGRGDDDGGGQPGDALPAYLDEARLELSEFELRAAAREAADARAAAVARREARAASRAAAASQTASRDTQGGGGAVVK